jgi:hypothetical protein
MGEWLCQQLWDEMSPPRLAGEDWEFGEPDDDDDDGTGPTVLVRKRDGARFEVEVEVFARQVVEPTEHEILTAAGQTAIQIGAE